VWPQLSGLTSSASSRAEPFELYFPFEVALMPKSTRIPLLAAVVALLLAVTIPAYAQTLTTIATLTSTTGESPLSPLVQGFDGNLYGTATGGGAYFSGAVFQLTLSGVVTPLYSFCQN
jgi:uncharacterized repeat protein (TIGR03803 family)